MNRGHRRGFTMFELLVTVAVVSILGVIVVVVVNPVELQKGARDSKRFNDIKTISGSLEFLKADVRPSSWGTDKTVYISIPDANVNCSGITGLPALIVGWSYHCASSNDFRKIDGTGWIPLNFGELSAGSFFPVLPIDPSNTATGGRYFAYSVSSTIWKLSFTPESSRNSGKAAGDGGTYPALYELGTMSISPFQ